MLGFYKSLKDITITDKSAIEALDIFVGQIYKNYFETSVLAIDKQAELDNIEQLRCFLDIRTNQTKLINPTDDDVWIFGYGSLVWKADFPYIDRRRGYICGYKRRFYQHSIDHRGTSEKPGRVVTLLPGEATNDRVYGVAYRIAATHKQNVLDHLDYREKNGYERCQLQFFEFPESSGIHFDVIMYIATQSNESYAGEIWQPSCICKQIFSSAGPSGENREYLFNLANAMRVLFPSVHDEHLHALESGVRGLIEMDQATLLKSALCKEIERILKQAEQFNENRDADDTNDVQIVEQLESLRRSCDKTGWKEALIAKELKNIECSS